jgi:hypothetical protein
MLRVILAIAMLSGVFGLSPPGLVHAAGTGAIQHALQERYQPSRMAVSNPALEGHLSRRGTVLCCRLTARRPKRCASRSSTPSHHASTCATTSG